MLKPFEEVNMVINLIDIWINLSIIFFWSKHYNFVFTSPLSWRIYWKWAHHNSNNYWNKFSSNSSKHEKTKTIPRCHRIMKLAGGISVISEKLCSLQEMDQRLKDWLLAQQYRIFISPRGYQINIERGYCLSDTKHIARMVTITAFSYFFNLK